MFINYITVKSERFSKFKRAKIVAKMTGKIMKIKRKYKDVSHKIEEVVH